MSENTAQIIYILTNPAMPGLVKVGRTTDPEIQNRMRSLYTTGVPVPFKCAFACMVENSVQLERALHNILDPVRVNKSREFFEIHPNRIIPLLRMFQITEITSQVEETIESDMPEEDQKAAKKLERSRRPKLVLENLGIPVGAVLFSKDGKHQAIVAPRNKVEFQGKTCSLSTATKAVLGLDEDVSIRPAPYWTYEGKTLLDLYEESYGEAEAPEEE